MDWPAEIPIANAELRISAEYYDASSRLNMRPNFSALCGSAWLVIIETAPLCVDSAKRLAAYIDQLDGGANTTTLPLSKGWLSNAPDFAVALLAEPTPAQASQFTVAIPETGQLRAGSLIGVIQDGQTQLFDVLETVDTGGETVVDVWPRAGRAFQTGAAMTFAPVPQWFLLDDDQTSIERSPTARSHRLTFREHVPQ